MEFKSFLEFSNKKERASLNEAGRSSGFLAKQRLKKCGPVIL